MKTNNFMYNEFKEVYLLYYNDLIRIGAAICKDFKISFESFFKHDFIVKYIYEQLDKNTLYNEIYSMQKVYNELYKKCLKSKKLYIKGYQNIIDNIYNIIMETAYFFNYDISKMINKIIESVGK